MMTGIDVVEERVTYDDDCGIEEERVTFRVAG